MKFAELFLQALDYLRIYHRALFKALFIPMLVFVASDILRIHMAGNNAAVISINVFQSFVVSTIAITIHRFVILGTTAVPAWGILWGKRESVFLIHVYDFILMSAGIFLLVLSAIHYLGLVEVFIASFSITIFLVSRFYFILIGIAIDQAITFKMAWKMSRVDRLSLFLIMLLFFTGLLISLVLVRASPTWSYVGSLYALMAIVISAITLSLVYKDMGIVIQEYQS